MFLLTAAATLSLLVPAPLPDGAGTATAEPRFVPEASSAVWRDPVTTVTFREVGLEPGAATTVAVTAKGSLDTACVKDGTVVLSVHSSASVDDTADYLAGPDGSVEATRDLTLSVRPPTVEGLDCAPRSVRTLTVTLTDLDTGAVLTIAGRAAPAR